MRDIAIFSGTAHPELAAEICAHLDLPLRPVRVPGSPPTPTSGAAT